jgi:hypothetical protein
MPQNIDLTALAPQDLGQPDETMQPATFAADPASATSPESATAAQTATVPINWTEVSYLTGVAQNGSLTSSSYWGFNGETARRWMTGTSAISGPAGGPGGTVTYYFDSASNWNQAERASFVGGLDLWSAVANIQFAQASGAATADVVFYRGRDGGAYTSTPAYSGSGSMVGRIAGNSAGSQSQSEISIDTSQVSWSHLDSFSQIGGYGISTIVHEEGHLIGLGHAGPYNGTVNPATQQNSAFDTRLWSTMSYIRPEDTQAKYSSSYPVSGTDWGHTSDFYYRAPYTPMPLDILAAQQLYGVAANTPLSGGQVFGFNCNIPLSSGIRSYFDFTIDTSSIITLYDTGPNNTLDLSGYSQSCTVDLRDGHFSSVAGLTNNIAIAYNTRIDGAVGGTGGDSFQVNANNDTINGGAGNDSVSFLGNRADYRITRSANGIVTVTDSMTSRGGTDQLANIETLRFADQWIAASSVPLSVPAPSTPPPIHANDLAYASTASGYNHFIDMLNFEASYPDLIRAFGTNQQSTQNWYNQYEPAERRVETFDGLDYIASHSDLINAYASAGSMRNVEDAGATHFITNGLAEGRSTTFNGLDYIASNSDLIAAFGPNSDAGAYHFIENGYREGRTTTFDGLDYIASYTDLISAFGANEQRGAAHYIANGVHEGRATTFDGLSYIAQYTDLMTAFGSDNDAGAAHYIANGFREGRATSFNVAGYEQAHPDLLGQYSSNDAFLAAYISTYRATGQFLT